MSIREHGVPVRSKEVESTPQSRHWSRQKPRLWCAIEEWLKAAAKVLKNEAMQIPRLQKLGHHCEADSKDGNEMLGHHCGADFHAGALQSRGHTLM